MFRIGQSSDVHQLVVGRPLILGGVVIPHDKGLLGHSDADALLHAIIEAILGAMGLGDIGTHFPDTDPQFAGISSMVLLALTYKKMKEHGYVIGNVDSLVMIEKPKLACHLATMKHNIAVALCCDESQINVKATRGEGLGYVGREEGVMAQAVVILSKENENGKS